jgi:hypothetical protein
MSGYRQVIATRLGLLVTGLLAALLLPAGAPAAMPPTGLEQECIAAGLAEPQVMHKPEMDNAGIRVATPRPWHWQSVRGGFEYGALPEGCAPAFVRIGKGQLQMRQLTGSRAWIDLPNRRWQSVGSFGNKQGHSTLSGTPNHAWPDWQYNACTNGRFQPLRLLLRNFVKDGMTGTVLAEKRYQLPVAVHGNCQRARISKRLTAHVKEEWGDESE